MKATVTIEEAAELLGIGRNTAYAAAARDGALAGVPVINVGRRKVLARAQLLDVLGITDAEAVPSAQPATAFQHIGDAATNDDATGEEL